MDDQVLEVMAGAHSSGASGLLGRPDAEKVLKALQEAGYAVTKVLPKQAAAARVAAANPDSE